MGWTPGRLPDQHGKTYVITDGNSGLGLEAAKILAGKGARVVITAATTPRQTRRCRPVGPFLPDGPAS